MADTLHVHADEDDGDEDEPSCICGDDGLVMHLWPLFSFEELRNDECPIHPYPGDLG